MESKMIGGWIAVGASAGIGAILASCLNVAVTQAPADAGTVSLDGTEAEGGTAAQLDEHGIPDGAPSDDRPLRGQPEDLAVGQNTPRDIIVDAAAVYWLNLASGGDPGAIVRLAKSDGAKPGIVVDRISNAYAMAADATSFFWTGENAQGGHGLFRHDKRGGDTSQVAGAWMPLGCAVFGDSVYWIDAGDDGQLATVGTDGTSGRFVGQNLGSPKVVVVDAVNAYVGAIGQILTVPLSGDPSSILATATGAVDGITADDTSVYWIDATGVRSIVKDGSTKAVDLAPGSSPAGIAIDATNVYWTNGGDGTVRTVHKSGGKVSTLAFGESEPGRIAVDSDAVYWTNHGDGSVRRIRR